MGALQEAFPTWSDGIADRRCRYSAFRRTPQQQAEVNSGIVDRRYHCQIRRLSQPGSVGDAVGTATTAERERGQEVAMAGEDELRIYVEQLAQALQHNT